MAISLASHITSKGNFQLGALTIGVVVKYALSSSKLFWKPASQINLASFFSSFYRGLAIFEKSMMNLLSKPACPNNCLTVLIFVGEGSLEIKSIFQSLFLR